MFQFNCFSLIATVKHQRPDIKLESKFEKIEGEVFQEDPPKQVADKWLFGTPFFLQIMLG